MLFVYADSENFDPI